MPNLVDSIKKAALDVVAESKPLAIIYGTVESENPIKIRIDQKLSLTENFLTLTNSVKDFSVDMSINGIKQKCTIHNKLNKNEKVILLRMQGGQRYIVLDRM